jgi:hypothetical protein
MMNHRLLPLLVLALLGVTRPAAAHQGPPFPILVDQRAGPYVVSVWTDPDIGIGTFFVILETPKGAALPAGTRVQVGVQPVTKRLREAVYEARLQPASSGAPRYFTQVPFDRGEMWRIRILVNGGAGGGILAAEVEATPEGSLGRIDLLLYLLPFLGIGFLWLKAVLRRRGSGKAGKP